MFQPSSGVAAQVSRPTAWVRTRALLRQAIPGASGRWALALIALGTLIRLGLLLLGWPATDSDEGTMGLMALHIATRGEHPLFFYGQSYMGTLQAYLGAGLFQLFGASIFSLRLGLLLLFILLLVVMYLLLRLLYGQTYALIGLLLLALGGPDLLKPQLLALGGYPETLLFGALSLLLALRLALGAEASATQEQWPGWRRLALYGALGLTLGVAWWTDQLIFPFLLVVAALLYIFCRRELRWRGLCALASGLLIGVFPQILYLLTHGPATAGPSAVDALEWQGMSTLARLPALAGAQAVGAFVISLPNITGAGWVCAIPTLPTGAVAGVTSAGALACAGLRLSWTLALLTLGLVAGLAAWQSLRAISPLRRIVTWSADDRRRALVQCGRLALLAEGALTVALYLVSAASATAGQHTRYLIGLEIALPALAYPLWASVAVAVPQASSRVIRVAAAWFGAQRTLWPRRAALGLLVLTLLGGVAATYRLTPATRASARADQRLIRDLERLGIRHMHTDYWTCDKVAFLSHERITCDVLTSSLAEGFNRYPPYVAQVAADPHAAYAFPVGLPQAAALAQRARDPAWPYTRTVVDGYDVWRLRS